MDNPIRKTSIKAHQREFEKPIKATKGDTVTIVKRDLWQEKYLWLWCTHPTKGEGYVPETYLTIEGDTGILKQDYDAIELSIAVGEDITLHQYESGWYWCTNSVGEQGWIPFYCFDM